MQVRCLLLHHNGLEEWRRRGLDSWIVDIFSNPGIAVHGGGTRLLRSYVRDEFTNAGWSDEVRLLPGHDVTVFARREDLAFQLQTGNISRGFYDLLKLQYLLVSERINAGALAVPSREAAVALSSNVVNAERLYRELQLYSRVISIPLLIVGFE